MLWTVISLLQRKEIQAEIDKPSGTWWLFFIELAILALPVFLVYRYFAPRHKTPKYATITVTAGWYLSMSIFILIPIDIAGV